MCDSYETLAIRRQKRWRESDVQTAQASFERACMDLHTARTAAAELSEEIARGPKRSAWAFWARSAKDRELAELQTEIECLRALVYQATEQYVKGRDVTKLASMAKLKAGRLGREVSDACLQYWGGMGFMWDNPVSRAYRDVRLVSIGGGADEIMLGIICKLMGILPGKKK